MHRKFPARSQPTTRLAGHAGRMKFTTRRVVIGVAALAVLAVGGFAGVYLALFNPKPVAVVALPTPVAIPSSSAGGALASTGARWTIGAGSFVGYRVREQLASLPAPSDAVGRTSAVSGGATVTPNADGSVSVSAVTVKADLTQLSSDSARRDGFVQRNSLETGSFPDASFVSTEAFTCPASVVAGSAGSTTIKGRFTIHGQTRDVSIPIQVQRSGTAVNIVATYKFNWGDYGVQSPQVPVASVQGSPVVEMSLALASA